MQRLLVTAAAFLAIAAVVPANAQTVLQKNSAGRASCFYQTDNSRLTGYYGACSEKLTEVPNTRRNRQTEITNVVTIDDNNRDSGGGGSGGGGGGGNGR